MKFIWCVVWCCVWWSSPAHSIKKILLDLGEPNPPVNSNVIDIKDEWFLQKLDHFNPINNRTWKQVTINYVYYDNNYSQY